MSYITPTEDQKKRAKDRADALMSCRYPTDQKIISLTEWKVQWEEIYSRELNKICVKQRK